MEQTSATIELAMMRTTWSKRAWAGPPPAIASRIWRRRFLGPLVDNPPLFIASLCWLPRGRLGLDLFEAVGGVQGAHGQLGPGRVEQNTYLDLRCRDRLNLHPLVGEGLEHGLGDAGVDAHADPDDRDLGHIVVEGEFRETELALRV